MSTQEEANLASRGDPVFDRLGLRRSRKLAGLTQEELGRKLGVTLRTITHWESGTGKPSAPAIRRLAEVFDRPTETFFEDLTEDAA